MAARLEVTLEDVHAYGYAPEHSCRVAVLVDDRRIAIPKAYDVGTQMLDFDMTVGQTYTLSVDLVSSGSGLFVRVTIHCRGDGAAWIRRTDTWAIDLETGTAEASGDAAAGQIIDHADVEPRHLR